MNIFEYKNIFLIGVGGIGMSALARYFVNLERNVAGYDKTSTDLTKKLEGESVKIHYDDKIDIVPETFKNIERKEDILIIYTPAIPNDNLILSYFKNNNFNILKRSEVLGEIVSSFKGIAVAGTHGKTSVSAMLAHILSGSELGCSAFLGGISKNINSNFITSSKSEYVVAEADEFDRSFLRLYPYFGVITSIDADHLDIYENLEELQNSFSEFVKNIKNNGTLFIKKDISIEIDNKNINVLRYSLNNGGDYYALNIRNKNGFYTYDVKIPNNNTIFNVELGVTGLFNIENSIAAIAVANQLGVSDMHIKEALKDFNGIKRRFEYKINDEIIYIDDYAHHPEEIKACIDATKKLYTNKKITGIFQPHLYSRTKDFAGEFAKSLEILDEIIILDIYPARELPIEGVSSEIIFNKIKTKHKYMSTLHEIVEFVKNSEIEVLLTMGAGNIDTKVEEIKSVLLNKYNIEAK